MLILFVKPLPRDKEYNSHSKGCGARIHPEDIGSELKLLCVNYQGSNAGWI